MKYKMRDKIGAMIWFAAYGLSLLILGSILFTPFVLCYLRIIPIWVGITSTIVLTWFIFDLSINVQNWLDKFENWLRYKLDL
jgi:ABC-type transporter Mla maintaining outer membrane lipid asymmetry permease subunit MlaE